MEFGSVNYDVPTHRRKLYTKLRAGFRRQAVMQTMSSYLFPWGKMEDIVKVIQSCNTDKDGTPLSQHDQVRFACFKYDEKVSGAELEKSAKESLRRMISTAKVQLMNKVEKALAGEDESDDDPFTTARAAAAKCNRTLDDVKALCLIFNLTDDLTTGIVAFSEFVEQQREKIKEAQKQVVAAAVQKSKGTQPPAAAPKVEDSEEEDLEEEVATVTASDEDDDD